MPNAGNPDEMPPPSHSPWPVPTPLLGSPQQKSVSVTRVAQPPPYPPFSISPSLLAKHPHQVVGQHRRLLTFNEMDTLLKLSPLRAVHVPRSTAHSPSHTRPIPLNSSSYPPSYSTQLSPLKCRFLLLSQLDSARRKPFWKLHTYAQCNIRIRIRIRICLASPSTRWRRRQGRRRGYPVLGVAVIHLSIIYAC